ncbi:MAG TPA: ribosome recycling factor [Clostridiaceae bacterium]|nr:ribosome recycling factor [Clostridiaceae bacterium]
MASEDLKVTEEKMKKSVSLLKQELSRLRAGRANPAILDKIKVDYYGVPTPINQIASINVPEARVIVIQPWDSKNLKDIEKAIQKSDIGINPSNDGRVIRLVFPVLTEERRKELTKTVKKIGEDTKVAIRAIRRDAIEEYRIQKKNGEITEDDLKMAEKDIQALTDKYIEEVDKIVEAKEKEILEI